MSRDLHFKVTEFEDGDIEISTWANGKDLGWDAYIRPNEISELIKQLQEIKQKQINKAQ